MRALLITVCYRILAIVFGVLDKIDGFKQHFALSNYSLQYPYAVHERVPIRLVYVVAILCPALIIAFWTIVIDGLFSHKKPNTEEGTGRRLGRYRLKERLWELNCGILGLALSEGVAFVITGKQHPHYCPLIIRYCHSSRTCKQSMGPAALSPLLLYSQQAQDRVCSALVASRQRTGHGGLCTIGVIYEPLRRLTEFDRHLQDYGG